MREKWMNERKCKYELIYKGVEKVVMSLWENKSVK